MNLLNEAVGETFVEKFPSLIPASAEYRSPTVLNEQRGLSLKVKGKC